MAWRWTRTAAAAVMMLAAASGASAQEAAFDFALVGDMPYTKGLPPARTALLD
jgi:hypothetical protein